jgi:hypothetical protein
MGALPSCQLMLLEWCRMSVRGTIISFCFVSGWVINYFMILFSFPLLCHSFLLYVELKKSLFCMELPPCVIFCPASFVANKKASGSHIKIQAAFANSPQKTTFWHPLVSDENVMKVEIVVRRLEKDKEVFKNPQLNQFNTFF